MEGRLRSLYKGCGVFLSSEPKPQKTDMLCLHENHNQRPKTYCRTGKIGKPLQYKKIKGNLPDRKYGIWGRRCCQNPLWTIISLGCYIVGIGQLLCVSVFYLCWIVTELSLFRSFLFLVGGISAMSSGCGVWRRILFPLFFLLVVEY